MQAIFIGPIRESSQSSCPYARSRARAREAPGKLRPDLDRERGTALPLHGTAARLQDSGMSKADAAWSIWRFHCASSLAIPIAHCISHLIQLEGIPIARIRTFS